MANDMHRETTRPGHPARRGETVIRTRQDVVTTKRPSIVYSIWLITLLDASVTAEDAGSDVVVAVIVVVVVAAGSGATAVVLTLSPSLVSSGVVGVIIFMIDMTQTGGGCEMSHGGAPAARTAFHDSRKSVAIPAQQRMSSTSDLNGLRMI